MPGKRLVQASQGSLETLARLRAQKEALEARKLATLDVFGLIGYEPNCLPRFAERTRLAAAMGLHDPFDRRLAESGELPEPCGKCPQELFHTATEFDLLFGGSAGGGKSVALVAEGLKWCARHAGLRVLLVRRSYDELEESIFPALRKFGNGEALGAKLNKVTRELSFPNGSLFRFRYLETVDDAARRQGGEAQLLLVDEYTLLSPGIVDFLRFERLRSGAGQPVIGVRCTANPGGIGHSGAVARYIEPTEYGRKVVTDEHGLTVRFIPARATQNPHLDPGYVKRLDAIPDPNRRAAMRDGDWSVFSGMVFPDFAPDRHVTEPMPLPPSWLRYSSVDWGYTAPWAVLWAAVDEDGRAWVYREIYEKGVGEEDQARRILAAEGESEHITARWADDAMWALRGDAKPIANVYADGGVHLTPAGKGPGSRVQGWQRWHSYLAEDAACPHHRALGWETCPKIHIFSTCRNLIAEIRALPYATVGNLEDSDPKAADHACLTAGTLVETAAGPQPIERIQAGDRVQTRRGLRQVTAAGLTARQVPVGTVLLSDGTRLRGTASHPVWVQGHGWKRLDALRYSDIISTLVKGRTAARLSCSAGSAGSAPPATRSLRVSGRGSAQTTASTGRGLSRASTTRRDPASCAPRRSRSTSTCGNASAPVAVLASMRAEHEPHDVYNLTVEGAHEFYANGVLVHNCDAGRYLLTNLGGGAQFFTAPPPPAPLGPGAPLTPMGNYAVRDAPKVAAADRRQGATQTWQDALVSSRPT